MKSKLKKTVRRYCNIKEKLEADLARLLESMSGRAAVNTSKNVSKHEKIIVESLSSRLNELEV